MINKNATQKEIIRKTANIVPSARQLRWQKMELMAFIHFDMNTFTNKEWGEGPEDPKLFNYKKFDAEQWVKSIKDAGFKEILLTCKTL